MRLFPQKSACCYTPFYCEENVWKMCESVSRLDHGGDVNSSRRCYAVFISNRKKAIPLWHQKAKADGGFVMWDYHVIFLQQEDDDGGRQGSLWVYDLDCTLDDFPVSLEEYLTKAVREERDFLDDFKRRFRVVPADTFLEHFASDRSHMLDEEGEYVKPPPSYPAIRTTKCDNNLDSFISMEEGVGWGRVMALEEFRALSSRNMSVLMT